MSLQDSFWLPRLETNRTVSIPVGLSQVRGVRARGQLPQGRGSLPGPYVGKMPFEDTEVYKAIEGASYSLAQQPDPELAAYLDGLIDDIAAAQEPDGYLYTNRTIDPAHVLPFAGPARWSNLVMSHELYNCGHLYEAASAHFLQREAHTAGHGPAERGAGPARLRPEGRHDMCGHQIVEMGLARLYRITGQRLPGGGEVLPGGAGPPRARPLYTYADNPGYCQDHLPGARTAGGGRPRGARGLHVLRHGGRGRAVAG